MGVAEIILIAIGLAMDAFAVAATIGLSSKKLGLRDYLIPACFFGAFQAIMPAIGWFLGRAFAAKIQAFDHWIAFVLLGLIGIKMIIDSLKKESVAAESEEAKENSYSIVKMLVLATATSIDALAIGVSFAFLGVRIGLAIAIIGIITFFIAILGVRIGNIFGLKFKSKAELAGGIILVALGIKIFIEHMFF